MRVNLKNARSHHVVQVKMQREKIHVRYMFTKVQRKQPTLTSGVGSVRCVCVCGSILLRIIAVGRCESFECHIIKLMAMQAQKLHFKCFLNEEMLNWLQIACEYTLQCKQKHKRDAEKAYIVQILQCVCEYSASSCWWCCGFLCEMHFPNRLLLSLCVCLWVPDSW